jgi:conjugal transfer pilus assembly protein TraB
MENWITKTAKEVSKKQKVVVIGTIAVITVVFLLFLASGTKKKEGDLSKIITKSGNKIILQDSSKGIKAEDRWLYDAQNKLDDVDEFIKQSEQDKGNIESRLSEIEQKYEEDLSSQSQVIEDQSQKISALESKIKDLTNNKNLSFNQAGQGANPNLATQELPKTIASLELNLESAVKSKKGLFNINDYIPAGAYAKATIISGVDASVGISSQSDPRPVLIRIKGPAISSIYDGNVQKADLTGCLVQGAASGDLSSEKIYVKLITLTCGKGEETITEIPVKGYVAGQGKSGIRGNVISREGDLLVKSFLAGLVSGFGQGLEQKVAPPLAFSNGLTTQQTMSNGDVVKKGFGKGVSTASDRLANYLIDRAEQYQPVVSIPSGIDVEVVFLEGFYFNPKDDKKSKKNNQMANNQSNNYQ